MPSDKPDEVKKWRHPVSAVKTLEPDAFAEMVLENGLRVLGPYQGYLYAALASDDGYDMFRTPPFERYFYNDRRVTTQANAAGGAIILDITPPTGQAYRLVALRAVNSGTNTITITLNDEDNATTAALAEIASAAGTKCHLPSIGAAATATGNTINSQDLIISKGQSLSVYQTGAGVQNDTLTVGFVFEVLNPYASTAPTWSKARSTNQGDVTIATSTISSANTLTTAVTLR